MTKLGIIGLGHMGGYHANAAQLIPNIKLVGIADPNEQNWSKIKNDNIIKTKNYKELLDLVDAVIIAVPTDYHYEIAKDCLLNNKHILVEKPLTKNIEQAKELFQIAESKNLALHVGHVERFNGAVQEVNKIIHQPYMIECHRIGPFTQRVQKDSVIIDLMIHDIDLVLSLVDSEVKSFSVVGNKLKTDLCDIATVILSFANGVLAKITSSRVSETKQRTMLIHQNGSYVKLDFATQDISIYRNSSNSVKVGNNQLNYKQEETIERLFVYKDNPLKSEIEYFINSVRNQTNLRDTQKNLVSLGLTLKIDNLLKENLNDCNYCGHREFTSPCL